MTTSLERALAEQARRSRVMAETRTTWGSGGREDVCGDEPRTRNDPPARRQEGSTTLNIYAHAMAARDQEAAEIMGRLLG